MISPQQIVVTWIEYAAAGAILLVAAKIAVSRLRQPVDRTNLIVMTFVATAVVPLLPTLMPVPIWHLRLVTTEKRGDTTPAATPFVSPDLPREPEFNREAFRDPPVEPAAIGSPVGDGPSARTSAASTSRFNPWWLAATSLLVSYCLAAGLFVAEWFVSARWLQRISARARPAPKAVEDAWTRITQGRGDSVPVRISTEITAPLAYGCLRPTVVIPESIAEGDPAALRFCLVHEWSHVANGDLRAWRLTWACQFLLWFQPLFWMLRRELRVCQDILADHRAASAGRDRIEYSELLVAFAQQQNRRPIAGTIAFFDRSSQLSRRISMLLSSTLTLRSRSPVAFSLTAGTLSLVCSILIGAVRLDSVQAGDDAQAASSEPPQEGEASQSSDRRENRDHALSHETKTIRGRVMDETGMPIRGAQLWLPLRYQPRRVVHGTTDESGRFELEFPANWISPFVTGSSWTLWAYAPGHSIATQSPFEVVRGKSEKDVEIKLGPQGNSRFRVLTPAGEPLAGALVQPQHYTTTVGSDLVPPEMLSSVSSRTDTGGIVTLSAVQPGPLFRVQVVSDKFGKQAIRVDRDTARAVRDIRLRETGRIGGRLIGERPEWLRGVRLTFTTDNQDEWIDTQGEASVVTDHDGHFQVSGIASGGPLRTYLIFDSSLPVRPRLNDNLYLAPGETLSLEIPLASAPKVYGKVQAKSSGKPIANAEILLGYGGFQQHDFVVTNEEGRFEGRVLPGPVRVHIISLPDDYVQLGAPWAEPYEVPSGVAEFELPTIDVVGTHKLTGQLIGDEGQPLSDVQVMAVDKNRRYGFAKTDSAGSFTMNVPDGVATRIEVFSDERGQEPVTVVQQDPLIVRYSADTRAKAMEAEREAKADVTLTGRVFSGGRPLAGVLLTLSRGVPMELPDGTAMRIQNVVSSESDADGHYRLIGLKSGDPYQIDIRPPFPAADPAWPHQLPSMPSLPEDAHGEVTLPDVNLHKLTQSLAGKVVDPEGNGVPGAQVIAMLRDDSASIQRMSMAGPPPWTETDQDGRFKLQQLPDEPLAIMAYMKSSADERIRFPAKVNVQLNQQDIRIVLDPSLVQQEE
jgi:beta-lactamase regulating signal transducer with metallopeptidase domain